MSIKIGGAKTEPGAPNVLSTRLAGLRVTVASLHAAIDLSVTLVQSHMSRSKRHSPGRTFAPFGKANSQRKRCYWSFSMVLILYVFYPRIRVILTWAGTSEETYIVKRDKATRPAGTPNSLDHNLWKWRKLSICKGSILDNLWERGWHLILLVLVYLLCEFHYGVSRLSNQCLSVLPVWSLMVVKSPHWF